MKGRREGGRRGCSKEPNQNLHTIVCKGDKRKEASKGQALRDERKEGRWKERMFEGYGLQLHSHITTVEFSSRLHDKSWGGKVWV